MEVKIKQGSEMIDATIEIVDGVMVVSPKGMDLSKFKDGDILVCGWENERSCCEWCCILKGNIEHSPGVIVIEEHCSIYIKGKEDKSLFVGEDSDSAEYVRYATEEEKEKLFKAMDENGYEWDAENRELRKKKCKPKDGDLYYSITVKNRIFIPERYCWGESSLDEGNFKHLWIFEDGKKCKSFCDDLNKVISKYTL